MRRLIVILMTGVLFAFVAGACGGDDDSSEQTDSADDATTEPADTDDDGDGDAADILNSERCSEAARSMAAAAGGVSQALTGSSSDDLEESIDELDEFADEAPDEIKADIKVIADGYAAVAQVLVDADFDPGSGQPPSAEVIQKLQQASEDLDNEDFQAAVERVDEWFKEECGG
jgi:hypothetical protein